VKALKQSDALEGDVEELLRAVVVAVLHATQRVPPEGELLVEGALMPVEHEVGAQGMLLLVEFNDLLLNAPAQQLKHLAPVELALHALPHRLGYKRGILSRVDPTRLQYSSVDQVDLEEAEDNRRTLAPWLSGRGDISDSHHLVV
jgi:hypothetical protein